MTKKQIKLLTILRTIADNPKITIGTVKKIADIEVSMSAIKKYVSYLSEEGMIRSIQTDNGFSLYVITDKGKSWIKYHLPNKRSLQDFIGECQECCKFSTRLSFFQGKVLCPSCLNHDTYRESPFKNKSSIYTCREYQ